MTDIRKQFDQIAFDVISANLATKMMDDLDSSIRTIRSLLPKDGSSKEFIMALLIRQSDLWHELLGTLFCADRPKGPASSELKLFAALVAHYTTAKVDSPFKTAEQMLKTIGHEVPETLIDMEG